MVKDTQSVRKSRDESSGNSSKKHVNGRKDSFAPSPVTSDKASMSREMKESPQGTRKSKRLDKGTPDKRTSDKGTLPSTPLVNKKSERVEKYNTPSSLRRSDRGKKDISSDSLGANKSPNDSSSETTRRKEKNLIQVTMESKRAELSPEEVGLKRKNVMNSRAFRGWIKKQRCQRILDIESAAGEKLERSEELIMGKLRDGVATNLEEVVSTLQDCPEEVKNEIHVHSSQRDDAMNEPCSKNPQTSSSVGMNCSVPEYIDISESDDSVSSDGPEVAEAITSQISECGNNLLGICDLCSKSRRVVYDSPEQELCSCSPTADEDLGFSSMHKDRSNPGADVTSDSQRNGRQNMCDLCNKDGELLCCVGRSCKSCYHLCCLDPSLTEHLPGVWHCPQCVKKKLLFGVHSVSEGVESIWDVREVEVSNDKGVRQKQYLVKYHGLAHIHNHWVPENQLLLENPCLVSNFLEKKETVRWSTEWTAPHRLLMRRSMQDKIYIASSAEIWASNYEWLVKWRGLDYDHATWELDNSNLLSSSLSQTLIKSYEVRREMAKQEINEPYPRSIVKLPELPANRSHANENLVLKNVNKLRESLFKCLNGVVFDDQERAMTVIFFIQSMSEICWPFLVVTTPGSLSHWEAEFAQLVPSLDVVVYGGSTDARKGIRASEFYDHEGRIMVRVLLSSVEAVSEDLEILKSIKWKGVVIDECQQSGISNALEQIKSLSMDSAILLVNGQITDTTSEYVKILSLLEPHGDLDKLRGLKPETNDNLCKLKDRLSRFIAYGRTFQTSKFTEYWIPVQISKFQLEQYCSALLTNSIPLSSSSRNDSIGALQDILLTVRKCCSHPYLLDASVQERLITEGCLAPELLDIGIKASGKLKLLDMMLTEIKALDLNVLIIFQHMGAVGSSTGDILDDFLRQRFGPSTYERIDAGINPSKKQAAVNRFNKKENGQFVFLLENRACSPVIKLSPVDVVVIYDSDWNPSTDLRALQKISIDSKVERIKVLRLYSSFTIEEKALVLAKQNLNLDNHLHNVSRATSESLLSWGATYLFSKLDEYHADSESNSASDLSSEQQFFDKVTKEFQSILSGNYESTNSNSIISEAKLGVGSYSTNIPVLGEAEVKSKDGEEPLHVFWKKLLTREDPKWKHLNVKGPSPRHRKRVRYWEGSASGSEIGKDDTFKKRKYSVKENLVLASVQVEPGSHQATPIVASKGGPSTIRVCNQSESFQQGQSPLGAEVSVDAISDERIGLSDEQKSLHASLQGEMQRLCQTLKLSEDVTHVVRKFSKYVMKNHHVNSDSPSIVQAFQLSLCWAAASITKQKVEKRDTILLAKQLLNYQCTEEQTVSVYSKMRPLKRMFLQSPDNVTDSDRDQTFAEDGTQNLSLEIEGKSANEEQNLALKDKTAASEIGKRIQRKCDKRMKKLIRKHQQEIQELQEIWEVKREELEKDHKLESAFIRSIHSQGSVGFDKLKLLEDKFAEKMKEHNLLKDANLKELKAKQLSIINEERRKASEWLAKLTVSNSQFDDNAKSPQPRTFVEQLVENENRESCVAPSTSTISAPAEAIVYIAPVENIVTTNSQNEAVEGTVEADRCAPVEQVSEDIRSELAVPNQMVEQICPGELSNASGDKTGKIVSSDDLVRTGQPLLPSEQTIASQDCGDLLPQQVQDDQTGRSLGSAQLQESDVPAVENQCTSQIELTTLEPMDNGTSAPSDLETPINDVIVTPVGCNQAPATENCGQGRSSSQTAEHRGPEVLSHESIPIDVPSSHVDPVNRSLCCNQDPATVNPNQAEHGIAGVLSHEPISQSGENLEMNSNQFAIGLSVDVSHGHSAESSAILQNGVAVPQAVVSPLEPSSRAIPQLDINVGNLHRQYLARQPTATNSAPLLLTDSLQNELERIRKETAQLDKSHEDMVSQLKTDCEKEIEELTSQIRKKYEVKQQDTDAVFKLKRNELDKNLNIVLRNKILAEAYRSKCLDLRPSGVPGMRQVVPSNLTQQQLLHQSALNRHSPGPSGSQPASPMQREPARSMQQHQSRDAFSPGSSGRPMQQQPQSRVRPSRQVPVATQSVAPPSVAAARPIHSAAAARPIHSAAAGTPPNPRPLVINAISPAVATTNPPRVGAANNHCSMPPHLQPFRPSTTPPPISHSQMRPASTPLASTSSSPSMPRLRPSSTPPTTSPSVFQLRAAQMLSSQPRPPQLPIPNLVTAELQRGMRAPTNSSPTMQGPMDARVSSSIPEQRPTSLLPDISSTFGALEVSDFEILASVQGNQASAVAKDLVCLSDDDN